MHIFWWELYLAAAPTIRERYQEMKTYLFQKSDVVFYNVRYTVWPEYILSQIYAIFGTQYSAIHTINYVTPRKTVQFTLSITWHHAIYCAILQI